MACLPIVNRDLFFISEGECNDVGPVKRMRAWVSDLESCLVDDGVLSQVYEYWRSKVDGPMLPTRNAIDPFEIRSLLPHIGLIDVMGDGDEFRYRLIGTHMVDIFGRDFTGCKLGDNHKDGAYGHFLKTLYAQCAHERKPVFCESQFLYRDDEPLQIRRLVMPLVDQFGKVVMLFFSNTFDWSLSRKLVTSGNADLIGCFPSEDIRRIAPIRRFAGELFPQMTPRPGG